MGKQLYVTNISFQATEEDMLKLFSVSGKVKTIKLLSDLQTGKFKGCGFVEMATIKEAMVAIKELDEALLIDRQITVVEARPPQPKERTFGADRGRSASGRRPNPKVRK